MSSLLRYLLLPIVLLALPALGEPPQADPEPLQPFLLGGIQTHELDHPRWAASLHRNGMNAVQVTAYAHQGPWGSSKLWFQEEEPAVLHEIRTARRNGLQVVLVLRVALDHNEPENRFLWHGLVYPGTEAETADWFRTYTAFVMKWARIAEREGVEVLGVASEMNSLAATLPVEEVPPLAEWYLDDESQQRLRNLVARSEYLFTEDVRLGLGAGDFEVLDDFLVERNRAERVWAESYTFAGAEKPIDAINQRRAFLEARWREMIEEVRKVYSGRLTLAANFDNYHEVSFWDALDFIGINAYFPLRSTLDTPLTREGLKDSWGEIFRDIDAFRTTHELTQPIVFTELGYTRWRGVTVAPWSSQGFIPLWDPDGDTDNDRAFFWESQPKEPTERALAMEALYDLWTEGGADLAGILYWKLSSRIELERYEPFMLHLGERPGDPLLDAFTRFAEGIRPLGPRTVEVDDPYRRGLDAIVRNDAEALSALGDLGPLVISSPPDGHPPLLHLAVRLGRGQLVRQMVAAGANLEQRDAGGRLPLHWICYQQDALFVHLLRPDGPGPWRDDKGETPLMPCARLDNQNVARALLQRGAPADARNDLDQTALHLAADQASRAMVDLLMAHGASVHDLDEQGTTPLHIGARRGELDIVQALARRSKGQPDRAGNLPVAEAVFNGKAEVFELLFDPKRVKQLNTEGQNLLHLAAFGGNPDILETLLPHFPKVDLPDANGWTPLFYAVADGQAGVVARLLERGASLEHRADDGATALHHGGACWEPRVLKELLRREVDINVADGKGNTPLHHAAGWGRLENMRQLLAQGADSTLRNRDDKTALDLAEEAGRRRAVVLLQETTK